MIQKKDSSILFLQKELQSTVYFKMKISNLVVFLQATN